MATETRDYADIPFGADDLKAWRANRPGRHKTGRHTWKDGWSAKQSAEWLGVHYKTWLRWERGEAEIPLYVRKIVLRRAFSYDEVVDRIFNTPADVVTEQGGVFPEVTFAGGGEE